MSVNEKIYADTYLNVISLLDLHSERGVHRHLFTHHRGEGELLQLFIKKKQKTVQLILEVDDCHSQNIHPTERVSKK